MAKIRLQGGRSIDVPHAEAVRRQDEWLNKRPFIAVASETLLGASIVSVGLDGVSDGSSSRKTYWDAKRALLSLTPAERAERSAWGHFTMFYWGVFGKNPDAEWRAHVVAKAVEFYTQNPQRTMPTPKCWQELLGLHGSEPMNKSAFNILSRVEQSQAEDMRELCAEVKVVE